MITKIFVMSYVGIFLCCSMVHASEYQMTFTRESGGRNGEYTMTTTDGSFWESNCPVYTPSHNYYMEYVFDGLHPKVGFDTEWLGQTTGITAPHWFAVTFPEEVYITKIRTYPIAYTNHWSSSYVMTSPDGVDYVTRGMVDAEPHIYDTDYENYHVDVSVNEYVKSIKYEFYDTAGSYYVVLPEIEFYADNAPVNAIPEPSTMLLTTGALLTLLRKKQS